MEERSVVPGREHVRRPASPDTSEDIAPRGNGLCAPADAVVVHDRYSRGKQVAADGEAVRRPTAPDTSERLGRPARLGAPARAVVVEDRPVGSDREDVRVATPPDAREDLRSPAVILGCP